MKRQLDEQGPEGSVKRHQPESFQLLCESQLDPSLLFDNNDDQTSLYSATEYTLGTQTAPTPVTTAPSPPSTTTQQTSASRRFPSDLKTIKCSYPNCPKTFNRPARLAAHLRSHTNDRPFKCPFPDCDKDYLEEKHLKQHVKGSHTHERSYTCTEPNCGKAFVTATRLRRHAAVHAGAERFRCRGYAGCDLSFRKHQTLQRHVRTDHLGLPAYICGHDSCGKGFDSAGAMKRHVDREHGELRFWCDECGAQDGDGDGDGDDGATSVGGGMRVGFTTMAFLQAHLRREHLNCIFCDARCGSQSQLDHHVEMYHSGTTVQDRKTVACDWPGCPKTFTLRKNLNAHVKTAHQGFRFVCGQVDTFTTPDITDWNWVEEGCGEGFISRMKLEEHVRFVHLGRKRPKKLHQVAETQEHDDGPDLIDAISGLAEAAKRNIPCPIHGCTAKFVRHHDLDTHIQHQHQGPDLVNGEQAQLLATVGGASEQGDGKQPGGLTGTRQAEGLGDDGIFLDPRLHDEEAVRFIAEVTDSDHQTARAGSEFEREWADMRRLIDVDALVN